MFYIVCCCFEEDLCTMHLSHCCCVTYRITVKYKYVVVVIIIIISNVCSITLTLNIPRPCVFPADWRGAGFPSEGANRPDQTPAGAPGAGDRQLRHREHAAGLRQPGHPGPSQGRLQMRGCLRHRCRLSWSPGSVHPSSAFTWPDLTVQVFTAADALTRTHSDAKKLQ